MIARVIAACARRPAAVIAAALVAAFAAACGWRALPRDAIPDLADARVALVAEWMGHGALDVAEGVTKPLTAGLAGITGAIAVRGTSMSGMAYVEVLFASADELASGRAEIVARVERARAMLPQSARVQVGPAASATGWVFQYALIVPAVRQHGTHASDDRVSPESLYNLRRFQDDVLRPALAGVAGVAEVASVGGEGEQLLVEARPDGLRARHAAFSDVVAAVRGALAAKPHATVEDVARAADPELAGVRLAADMTGGAVDFNAFIPTVGGIVIARPGADVASTIAGVKRVLDQEQRRLPKGVGVTVVYDRSELVRAVERTEMRALVEEIAAVAVVVLVFLLHASSALVPLLTLPLVVLFTFGAMWLLRVPVTVMSLAGIGIALGMAVDADVVALEGCHRRLEQEAAAGRRGAHERRRAIVAAGASFGPAILTSLMIAALSFLPVLAFTGETGRLLRPLALSKTLVFAAAALVALTVAPALRDRLFSRGRVIPELANPLTRSLVAVYRPFVDFALRRPAFTLATAVLAVASAVPIAGRLGPEFLPRIDEGDLLYMPTTAAGVPPEQAAADLGRQDQIIRSAREVESVFGKVGRADTATDPAPYSMAETTIRLRPRDDPGGAPARDVARKLDGMVRLAGWSNAWTAPIRARMDMLSTGVTTPVGVRVVAADPSRIEALAAAVRASVSRVDGTSSAFAESAGEETRLTFIPDDDAIAAHAVDPALVQSTAGVVVSGGEIGEVSVGGRRVRVRVVPDAVPRRREDVRRADELVRETTVRSSTSAPAGGGGPVPLAFLGRVARVKQPAVVRAERGELVGYVHVGVAEGTDLGGYVDRARRQVGSDIAGLMRSGERIEWVGQLELWKAGQRRLLVIAPLVLLSMLLLLYFQFRNLTEALIVLSSVPFALVGSFWLVFLLGYRMSAPVWVGLLSVVGLAMQMGVVMVVYIDHAFFRRVREGRLASRDDIVAAHAEGTVLRLRPKLMTVVTMAAALAPLLWATGAGAEIMKRVAAPMLGGLATSAFLTLEVLPVLYTLWRHRQLRRAQRMGVPIAEVVGPPPSWAR